MNDTAAPSLFDAEELEAIPAVLSAARFGTYLIMARGDRAAALRLYVWNAQVAATFGLALHLVEITLRNAVTEAIENGYGTKDWHRSNTFLSNLRSPTTGYNPRRDLSNAVAEAERQIRQREARERKMAKRTDRPGTPSCIAPPPPSDVPVGKVVAELRFAFWISMITSTHDKLVWATWLGVTVPHLPGSRGAAEEGRMARGFLHGEVDEIRKFRNRLAHHEPVLRINLPDMMQRIVCVVGWRSPITASWLDRQYDVERLSRQRP